ncbi:MAG: hypothetical protein ACRDUX_21670 [Mycobacterium sp.]
MIETALFGYLTIGSLVAVAVFACLAFVFVQRSLTRPAEAGGEKVAAAPAVLKKLRKREPLSDDEIAVATHVIARRRSLMAYSIPAAIFSIGCFYVFGSLEHLHGATPSERTFLGVIPMFTAVNVALQLLRSARLKRRLPTGPRSRRGVWWGRRDESPDPAGSSSARS